MVKSSVPVAYDSVYKDRVVYSSIYTHVKRNNSRKNLEQYVIVCTCFDGI